MFESQKRWLIGLIKSLNESKEIQTEKEATKKKIQKTIFLCQNGFSWCLMIWTENNVPNVKKRLSAYFNVDYRLKLTFFLTKQFVAVFEVTFSGLFFRDGLMGSFWREVPHEGRSGVWEYFRWRIFFSEWGNLVPDLTKNGTDEYDCPNRR